jgi:hypothetical protein
LARTEQQRGRHRPEAFLDAAQQLRPFVDQVVAI